MFVCTTGLRLTANDTVRWWCSFISISNKERKMKTLFSDSASYCSGFNAETDFPTIRSKLAVVYCCAYCCCCTVFKLMVLSVMQLITTLLVLVTWKVLLMLVLKETGALIITFRTSHLFVWNGKSFSLITFWLNFRVFLCPRFGPNRFQE